MQGPGPAVPTPVVFFDGVCALCDHFVDFLFSIDSAGIFKVSPLQSEYAKKALGARLDTADFRSILLQDESGVYDGSTAVLKIFSRLGGKWAVLGWLRVIPRPLRDRVYYFIAKNRYAWFGKKSECRMPTPEERARFIS